MLHKKKLALFFTTGISLKTWEKVGNLGREVKPYNELANYFDKIYFFTYGDISDLNYQNVLNRDIKIFPKKWKIPSKIYIFLLPFLYRKELKTVDILKTNQMNGAVAAVLTKWLYRKKLIIRCGYEWLSILENQGSTYLKRRVVYLIEKIAYKTANTIILTSQKDKEYVELKFKIPSSRIKIVPNYIDTDLFKPVNIKREENRIGFVGRLEEVKNLFNLIGAVSDLPIKLIIFGSGSLGEKLENYTRQKKANVEFRGNIPNDKLPEELNKLQIFILPSYYEGCPKVLLEAMSCGLPCIGTNVEGIQEIIKHKENGYLCETDAISIRKAILVVLNNKKLREKLSKNARKTIVNNFSLEKILEKEKIIYQAL